MKMKLLCITITMFFATALSMEEKSSAALFRDVFKFLEEKNELSELFDMEDDEIRDGVLQLFRDHGFDESDLMADGFFGGIWNMFFSGSKSTFQAVQLAKTLGCYQGKSGLIRTVRFSLKKYNEYGCYCGGGQSYGKPLDDTDRCCKLHDECYERTMKKFNINEGCDTYTTQYKTTCCKSQKITKCGDAGPSAGRGFCDCDQAMAVCVSKSKALIQYRRTLKNARKRKECRVPGKKTTHASRFWGLLKTCKNIRRRRKLPTEYLGQGKCPQSARRRRRSRWW
ncbi:uncharacterized protein LOC120338233 [Styela clava]